MQSRKMAVISCWNVEGALQSPICITWLLNMPSTVVNAALWTCSSTMRICSYALDKSSFDQYATLAISLQMISWSGNGVTSLTVLLFCSRKSKTVRSLLFFFSMQFCCYIFVSLFGVKILNIILYMSRCGVYACVRRWAICVCPREVWLSTGIDVRLQQASKMYMTVSVSIPRRCMRIDSVRF